MRSDRERWTWLLAVEARGGREEEEEDGRRRRTGGGGGRGGGAGGAVTDINSNNPHLTGGEKDNQSSLARAFVPMMLMTLGGYRICMYLLRYCDSDCD